MISHLTPCRLYWPRITLARYRGQSANHGKILDGGTETCFNDPGLAVDFATYHAEHQRQRNLELRITDGGDARRSDWAGRTQSGKLLFGPGCGPVGQQWRQHDLTLTGTNTYSGPTAVNQGELVINASLASPVTVNSGAVLGGTGHLGSVTVSSSGQIAPGDPLGTMTISGSLGLAASAVLDYELDTPLTSGLISCGTLVLAGQLEFSDFDFTWTSNFGPGTYDLIEDGSTPNGILGSSNSGLIDGYSANLAVSGNDLVLNVTPEPSALALLAAGAIGIVGYGWRRRATRTAKPRGFDQRGDSPLLSFPSRSSVSAARRAA